MATFTTSEKVQILDGAGVPLNSGAHSAVSSDPAIASIGDGGGFTLAVLGQTVGTATITVIRNSDGASATGEVEVVASAPFAITFGPAAPK